jgi:endonuclease G
MLLLWLVFTWTKVPSVRALPRATEQGATTANDHRTHRHRERGVPNVTQPGEHPASQSATNGNASSNVNRSIHVALGIPTDSDPSDDYLLDHDIYVVSYNPNKNVPNWVAWALDRSFLGHVRRKNDFRPDASLPSTFYHVTPQDYHDSGYDRGHLCPSADRDDSSANNSLTFLMTNVQPQLHELNAGPWEKLEEYERELAHQRDAELFIVAGGIFDTHYRSVGHGVAVPKANFKIIVALRQGQSASDVKSETKTIAVVMPNEAA